MNAFQDPTLDGTVVGVEQIGRDDTDIKFEKAQRFIDAHWTEFDDPDGISADLAELRLAVSGSRPTNLIRTRLTLHRLRRTAGNATPVAAVIAIAREILDTGPASS